MYLIVEMVVDAVVMVLLEGVVVVKRMFLVVVVMPVAVVVGVAGGECDVPGCGSGDGAVVSAQTDDRSHLIKRLDLFQIIFMCWYVYTAGVLCQQCVLIFDGWKKS